MAEGHRGGIPHGGAGGAGYSPRHLALEPSRPAVAQTESWELGGFDGKTTGEGGLIHPVGGFHKRGYPIMDGL